MFILTGLSNVLHNMTYIIDPACVELTIHILFLANKKFPGACLSCFSRIIKMHLYYGIYIRRKRLAFRQRQPIAMRNVQNIAVVFAGLFVYCEGTI